MRRFHPVTGEQLSAWRTPDAAPFVLGIASGFADGPSAFRRCASLGAIPFQTPDGDCRGRLVEDADSVQDAFLTMSGMLRTKE